jgi:gliding motility-associated-like protein
MRPSFNRAVLLFLFLFFSVNSFSQFNLFRPEIIGQTPSPLTTNTNEPITIQLSNLIVLDGDALPVYPNGFTVEVSEGKNYKLDDATVTPNDNFTGRLKVPVRVNDGRFNSKRFEVEIEVAGNSNARPEITGQTPLVVNQEQALTIELAHLQVNDPDNQYPDDFTLHVFDGNNYSLDGTTLKPRAGFTGNLKVPVSVNDGMIESKRYDLTVKVAEVQNIAPVITGQTPVNTVRSTPVEITLSHLTVTDPDNKYPDDFSLKVSPGNNYTVDGTTITPLNEFIGELTVKVKVNDSHSDSEPFDFKVQVNDDYKPPTITGQAELIINEDEPVALQLSHLTVTGGANTYPNGFSLIVSQGSDYTYTGTTITPKQNFSGTLSVNVKVHDGKSESAPFKLAITVKALNDVPVITGQVPLNTNKGTPLLVDLSHLKVSDVDNTYPDGFTLKISKGDNYSVFENNIHPAPDFVGILTVSVSVSDGSAESDNYQLKINVAPVVENKPPVITGQKTISIVQNSALTIHLSHLIVSDPDNKYPTGFTLKVLPGDNYSVEGTTIRPLPTFSNNTLSVGVVVNDGTDDSAPYDLKIQVVPSSSTPIINGQKELVIQEDSSIVILLSHLEVTDADNPAYPKGFSLILLPANNDMYTVSGSTIRPASNLNGFIEVGVKVSDGVNTSNEFKVSILVTPVNDPPEIINFTNTELAYEPGSEPITLFDALDLNDVDNDHLSMAEIGFRQNNYSAINDELLLASDSAKIKAIYDPAGILFLVGYATLDEYKTAIRSIHYNYKMTLDENGNPSEILAGTRTIYINLHDGQQVSDTHELAVNMETEVSLDIPNTFTPNGDMSNDTWHIHTINKDQLDKAVIRVYNKRGLLLYESIGLENDWNGIVNGQQLPVDTYYYTIDLNLSYMKKTYKGAVTILR